MRLRRVAECFRCFLSKEAHWSPWDVLPMQKEPRVHPSNFFERDRHFFERGTMKDFEEFWRPTSFQLEHNRCPDVLQPSSSPRMGAKVHAPFFWNGRCDADTLGGLNADVVLAGAPSIFQGIGGARDDWRVSALAPATTDLSLRDQSTCFPQHHDLASLRNVC